MVRLSNIHEALFSNRSVRASSFGELFLKLCGRWREVIFSCMF